MWQFTGKTRPNIAIAPKEGQESVWDYPRPPICQADSREVLVRSESGQVIAKTNQTIRVLETASPPTFYIPRQDVEPSLLVPESGRSVCEWKGAATYWSIQLNEGLVSNCAWSYQVPTKSFAQISGHLAFYPAKLCCFVDGERVRPQPGGFYGGWVTDEILGPYKGEPGTAGW